MEITRGNMGNRENLRCLISLYLGVEFPYLYTTKIIKIEITKTEIEMFYVPVPRKQVLVSVTGNHDAF